MTDFRALCAELLEGIERHVVTVEAAELYEALLDRARAALATSNPPAADSIVDDTGKPWHQTMSGALWAKAFVAMHGGDEELMLGWFCNAIMAGVDHTYWANEKAMRPIPVAERLPTEADCDKKGRVWAWDANEETWYREDVPRLLRGRYVFLWLPAAAIPLPEVTE